MARDEKLDDPDVGEDHDFHIYYKDLAAGGIANYKINIIYFTNDDEIACIVIPA